MSPITKPQADEMYGRLAEAVHFSGYSADRALQQLEWLLEDDRWRLVGAGRFGNIDASLESMKLDQSFRLATEERKRIATRIKELQPGASNRQIARTLRVNHKTVDRDLGANAPAHSENATDFNEPISGSGANAPPTSTNGVAAAQSAECVVSDQPTVATTGVEHESRSDREAEPPLTPCTAQHQDAITARDGIFSLEDFKSILFCLHPDTYKRATAQQRGSAWLLIEQHEQVLVKKANQSPSPSNNQSLTPADCETMKRQATSK